MWIQKHEFGTDIYPFASQAENAVFSARLVVALDGRVRWKGQDWTPEDVALYLEQLRAGFDKAFELAAKK